MFFVKFEGNESVIIANATKFKFSPTRDLVEFTDANGELVAVVKMDKVRGIFKQSEPNEKTEELLRNGYL